MKAHSLPALAAVVLGVGIAASNLHAQSIPLKQCPEPVVRTIQDQLGPGRVDKIKKIQIEGRVLYLVKIDLPGRRDRRLHIGGDGILLKTTDKIRFEDLPPAVRQALEPFLAARGRFDEAARVTASDQTEYHVEIDLPGGVDLHLVIGENGEILRRFEDSVF